MLTFHEVSTWGFLTFSEAIEMKPWVKIEDFETTKYLVKVIYENLFPHTATEDKWSESTKRGTFYRCSWKQVFLKLPEIQENMRGYRYDDDNDELFLWYGWPMKGV